VRSVRIGAGLLSVAMSLKTVGLVAGLFVVAPSAGSAVALLREATLVSAMLAGAAALLMALTFLCMAGMFVLLGAETIAAFQVLIYVGAITVQDVMVPRARIESICLEDGIETVSRQLATSHHMRLPVEIGLEVVLATCIGVL